MPSPVPFRKVRKLLTDAGWTLDTINGSRHKFKKAGCRNIVIPVHKNRVRWVYARQVEKEIAASQREDSGAA